MNNDNHKDLEQLIHRTLRSLPDRKAPRSLERQVMARIAARQAQPWYRQSFAHWPAAARIAFLGTCALALALLVIASITGTNPLAAAGSETRSLLTPISTVCNALRDSGSLLLRSIPSLWLYGALASIAGIYLAIFSLGATAYRTLLTNR